MKILSCFALLMTSLCLSNDQDITPLSSNYSSFVADYYEGGLASFEAHIQEKLIYPAMSKQRCEVGEAIVEVEFGKMQKIKNISFHNALSRSLNLSIVAAIKSTTGKWKTDVEETRLIMSFGFELGADTRVAGDIKLKGKQLFGPGEPCICTADIEKQMTTNITNAQYKKALNDCLELLRRAPRNVDYNQTFRKIMDNLL